MSLIPSPETLIFEASNGLEQIGYRQDLILPGRQFDDAFSAGSQTRQISLAAYAQEPTSYKTACLGVALTEANNAREIEQFRALGAPVILSLHRSTGLGSTWKMTASGEPQWLTNFSLNGLRQEIIRREDWRPDSILRAKNIAPSAGTAQLDIFDTGLIPAIEVVVHRKLNDLLGRVAATSVKTYTDHNSRKPNTQVYQDIFSLIFRLIAAKVLGDRNHTGGDWLNPDAGIVLQEVERYYFHRSLVNMAAVDATLRDQAWQTIRTAFQFQNLSVEALAYVYENTFVNTETRRALGTHATPYEIAEFIVRQLPIKTLGREERTVFEPFCGAAPFLVAAHSRLREILLEEEPTLTDVERHAYFARMLSGIETDAFAREVAIYSLILADYPNGNDWNITRGDVFSSSEWDKRLSEANIVLCNPPYRSFDTAQKASYSSLHTTTRDAEALWRVLQNPPKMLGFVLPRTYLKGIQYRETRQRIIQEYGHVDTIELPYTVFEHSKSETVMIMAYGRGQGPAQKRTAKLSAQEYEAFRRTQQIDWSHQPLVRVWQELVNAPTLSSVAEVHRGVEYEVGFDADNSRYVSPVEKPGFIPGLVTAEGLLTPYLIGGTKFLTTLEPLRRGKKWISNSQKVLIPAARKQSNCWPTVAMLDTIGLRCTQNFHGVWQRNDVSNPVSLEVIAAILNGPVSNAWLDQRVGKRHIQRNLLLSVPLPNFSPIVTELIITYIDQYISQDGNDTTLLLKIDAAVLDAYGLSQKAEKELLAWFNGASRPGMPGFSGYGPTYDQAKADYLNDLARLRQAEQHQHNAYQVFSDLEQATQRALAEYEMRLKPILEPGYNGQVVAIHSESGDYAVADTAGRARKAIRARHPGGYLLLHTIGPAKDLGLALRIMGSRLVSPSQDVRQ